MLVTSIFQRSFFRRYSPKTALFTTCAGGLSPLAPVIRSQSPSIAVRHSSFITMMAPAIKNKATSPSLKPITWSFGGSANATEADVIINSTGAVGWLNLVPKAIPEQFPRESLEARGVRVAAVSLAVPHGLTLDAATGIVAAAASFPSGGSLVVQCATGTRASAALAVVAAAQMGWNVEQVFTWAKSERLPFLSTQPLRNWVTISVQKLIAAHASTNTNQGGGIILRQLFHRESSTYTYLIGDKVSGEALLIDPVVECADRDVTTARELGLHIKAVINTHVHADHVSGASRLRGLVPGLKSLVCANSGAIADACLSDGDHVPFGSRHARVIATPGHTLGCISLVLDDMSAVFTGDALLIRGCGRVDFQDGSAPSLYDSVTRKLFSLPRTTTVYPGHDYNGATSSTIGEENDLNPRLGAGRSLSDFETIMTALVLAKPLLIDIAVPANLRDGIPTTAVKEEGILTLPEICVPCRQDGIATEFVWHKV